MTVWFSVFFCRVRGSFKGSLEITRRFTAGNDIRSNMFLVSLSRADEEKSSRRIKRFSTIFAVI